MDSDPPENSAGRRYDDRASVREIYVPRERNLHILAGIQAVFAITVQTGKTACRKTSFSVLDSLSFLGSCYSFPEKAGKLMTPQQSAAPGSRPRMPYSRPLLSRQVHLPVLPERLISEDGGAGYRGPFGSPAFKAGCLPALTHLRILITAPQTGLEPACRYYRPAVFQAAPPPVEGLRHIVGSGLKTAGFAGLHICRY